MKKTIKILLLIIFFAFAFSVYYFDFFNLFKTEVNNSTISNDQQEEINIIKIIAVGDSLTAGYGVNLNESYPIQLEKKLQENSFNVEVINAGISGETTAGLLDRVEFIKSNTPDMILITIGGNDALRNLPIESTEENILAIIKSFKEIVPANKIFLMEIKAPLNRGIAYANQFNLIYEKVAKQEKINLVPFVTSEVFLDSSLMLEDRIHPNQKGYQLIIDKYIYKIVSREL